MHILNIFFYRLEDLDPCISVTCQYYGQCQASSPVEAHCACKTGRPTFEDHVCGSNGKTYQNHCFYKLDVCQTRTNISVLRSGSCYGEYSQGLFYSKLSPLPPFVELKMEFGDSLRSIP